MTIWLVRHGKAGDRSAWSGNDERRPLSTAGAAQATQLATTLAPMLTEPRTLFRSSPATRCIGTIEPLATRLGTGIEISRSLAEGADPERALEELVELRGEVVACSHGDVIEGIVERLAKDGLVDPGPLQAKKGSVWVLETTSAWVTRAHYVAPPRPPTAST